MKSSLTPILISFFNKGSNNSDGQNKTSTTDDVRIFTTTSPMHAELNAVQGNWDN